MTPEMHRNAKHLITNSEHFEKDCDYFFCELTKNFHWFEKFDLFRKLATIAFVFVLGWKNFIALDDFLYFLSISNFDLAAKEIEKKGYHYIADVMKTGEIKFAETK